MVAGFSISTSAWAQLPTAQQIASKMKVGWNLGNTLEAICGETAWNGGVVTTQSLINSVKAAGFNTVRLPCAWFCHSDTVTSVIDPAWIARVKEVVDYCINDSLYVILNMHWDKGWLENRVNTANQALVNKRQNAYWTQIANYFKNYNEHLLFASANEPNVEDAAGMSVLLSYHQTFINAVRATAGNNSSRTLIVQGPATDIEKTYKLMNTMPTDQIANRLMVEVHYYTPYQFCLMQKDENWGKMFYYWGKAFHSTTDTTHNATWGEESFIDQWFGNMKTKFVDKGIPVIIGEYGAWKRKLNPPSDQALHSASVEYYHKYLVKSALSKGIIPFCWDINGGLFNRSTGAILDQGTLNAIMQATRVTTTE
jgi:aryl-phospho-beta-D-glucosidase BglC (GH1 family)